MAELSPYSSLPVEEKDPPYAVAFVLISFLLLLFFVIPFVPYSANEDLGLLQVNVKAAASPSYALFQCGTVSSPHIVGSGLGSSVDYTRWFGPRWVCGEVASS